MPNFAEIVKFIIDMIKKNSEVKWNIDSRASFDTIKKYIGESHVLVSLQFSKYFMIFSFASENTIVFILLQKNSETLEQPIALFRKSLRDSKSKYHVLEKQAYAMANSLKYFKTYVLHSKIIAYVPNSLVKDILVHSNSDGKRGKWLSKIKE